MVNNNTLINVQKLISSCKNGGILRFAHGSSFKQAWQTARNNRQRYFNYNGKTYNSKDVGNDTAWQGFTDNLEQASAQLTSSAPGTHLGWTPGPNNTTYELRGRDRLNKSEGTNATIREVVVTGHRISKPIRQTSARRNNDWQATAAQSRMHQLQEQQRNADQVHARLQNDHFMAEMVGSLGISPGAASSYMKVWKDPRTGKSYRYYTRDGINYIEGGRYWNPKTKQGGNYTYSALRDLIPFNSGYSYY